MDGGRWYTIYFRERERSGSTVVPVAVITVLLLLWWVVAVRFLDCL